MKRRTKLALAVGVAVLLGGAGGAWVWIERGLSQARALARYGLWPEARQALTRYLWLHPHEAQAHLLFAESLIKQDDLPRDEAIPEALAHLQAIPDTAPEAAKARIQEGRLEMFLLYHAARAERLLRQALELDPQAVEAHHLLWKLKDLTGRSHQAEADFWAVYDASPAEVRPLRLREWYMSQFYPTTANPLLDRLMGFALGRKTDPAQTEAIRFIAFRNAEPEAAIGHAALARWFQVEGDSRFALESLDKARPQIENAEQDPFYLATVIGILIELGEFDRAGPYLDKWPEPRQGYEYWVSQGQVLQEVRGQYREAIAAYDQALREWPGQVDWRTRNRKANCLARLRDQPGATRERERAKVIEDLMDPKIHQSLRKALGFLDDAQQLAQVVDFYQKIDRPREAAGWSEHIARLRSRRTAPPPAPVAPKS